MNEPLAPRRGGISTIFRAIYLVLNPLPFGFIVAALVFDAIYVNSFNPIWVKSAAWLLAFGLVLCIIPRLIGLIDTFAFFRRSSTADKIGYLLYVLGIVAAVFNAFVHSRDAYATMPSGLWLSIVSVVLLALGTLVQGLGTQRTDRRVAV